MPAGIGGFTPNIDENRLAEAILSLATSRAHREIESLRTDPAAFPTSIRASVAEYLKTLVEQRKPHIAVEIGCYIGFSTLHLASALEANNQGMLYSFDLDTGKAREHIARAGLSSRVHFTDGNSSVTGNEMRHILAQGIDFLFIDGDHTRRGCLRDARVFLPWLKRGGLLILHDIYPERCGWLGPRLLIDLLQTATNERGESSFRIVEMNELDPFGIAVCEKTADYSDHDIFKRRGLQHRYATSRLSQLLEIARFEGKRGPWQVSSWLFTKLRRISKYW